MHEKVEAGFPGGQTVDTVSLSVGFIRGIYDPTRTRIPDHRASVVLNVHE